jgi:Dolichyl-phosphate-mannose-protein mannosyltransferase
MAHTARTSRKSVETDSPSLKLVQAAQSAPEERWSRSLADYAVYTYIIVMGVFQLTHFLHTPDFVNDVTYPDLARSILDHGSYLRRLLPETTFPPGFPLILAAVGLFFGLSPATSFAVVAVSTTLGLIAAYELLRLVEGRAVAAVACLIFASSPALFSFNTSVLFPEMPFFLMSMLALLLAFKIDHAGRSGPHVSWLLLLSIALIEAVLIRSVGVALLAAVGTWTIVSLWVSREQGRRRLKRFLIPLVLASFVQLAWMAWAHRHETLEWPQLPGYPQSYLAQLKVKNGHYPELGLAHLSDIPSRVGHNVAMRAAGFSQLVTRRNVSKFWSSPAICGVILLIAVGVVSSLQNGGQLHDWYFLWHEFIFMLWPWDYRNRFLAPVIPLACLYLWRGVKALKQYSISRPRATGLALSVIGLVLGISSAAFAFGITSFPISPDHVRGDHLQTVAATLFWGAVMVVGLGMLKFETLQRIRAGGGPVARLSRAVESSAPTAFRVAGIVVLVVIGVVGTKQVLASGRYNLNPNITEQASYPMMKAAEWIRMHEPPDRVILAREPEIIGHYALRRAVWFPPISDPSVLMDGIRRHHIGVVVVVHQDYSYWLPSESECFQALLKAYPGEFLLVHRDIDNWVYEVSAVNGL